MEYKTLYKEFYNYVELNKEDVAGYIDENNIDETDGQHIWFGMVVVPYIVKTIKNNDGEKLFKISEFLGAMAKSKNTDIIEVLEFTILEGLATEYKNEYLYLKKYLNEETLKSCIAIEKYVLINR